MKTSALAVATIALIATAAAQAADCGKATDKIKCLENRIAQLEEKVRNQVSYGDSLLLFNNNEERIGRCMYTVEPSDSLSLQSCNEKTIVPAMLWTLQRQP